VVVAAGGKTGQSERSRKRRERRANGVPEQGRMRRKRVRMEQ
jgi:hypothetical protein